MGAGDPRHPTFGCADARTVHAFLQERFPAVAISLTMNGRGDPTLSWSGPPAQDLASALSWPLMQVTSMTAQPPMPVLVPDDSIVVGRRGIGWYPVFVLSAAGGQRKAIRLQRQLNPWEYHAMASYLPEGDANDPVAAATLRAELLDPTRAAVWHAVWLDGSLDYADAQERVAALLLATA